MYIHKKVRRKKIIFKNRGKTKEKKYLYVQQQRMYFFNICV